LERSKALTRDFVAFGHNRYTKLKQSIKDYSIPYNIKNLTKVKRSLNTM
jgi:hypothetical protein